ncbi:MAG: CoA transferase [Spirochaetota bacterium]|nr:CoA transferase [Spirochaetota bacterium]
MNQDKDNKTQNGTKPLDGIRVLEYGIFHAGPGASAILSDLGAEVIKIETKAGDPLRGWVDAGNISFQLPHDRNLMFDYSNRGKRGIILDIGQEKGRNIFNQLLKDSDVFVTNLRKSTKIKKGLDYTKISEINPKIIYASVSGFGPEGPVCDMGAYDPLGQAKSGMMFAANSMMPSLIHLAVLDQSTAIAASHAILTALLARERFGTGQEVHVSLYSTGIWLMSANIMANSLARFGTLSGVLDREHNSPLRNCFCSKDGKWVMGVHHPPERYWEPLCRAAGQEHLIDDSRFCDEEKRRENCAELVEIFDKVFATKMLDEWMELFVEHGLMFCPIQNFEDVLVDPQALENEYITDFQHPDLGNIKIPGYPVHFSDYSAGMDKTAPTLGEHTDEILQEMGFSDKEIQNLREEKVI